MSDEVSDSGASQNPWTTPGWQLLQQATANDGNTGPDPNELSDWWHGITGAVGGAGQWLANQWNHDDWPWGGGNSGSTPTPSPDTSGGPNTTNPDAADRNANLSSEMAQIAAQREAARLAAQKQQQGGGFSGFGGGGGGGMSAYQHALLEIERQKMADARAQAEARLSFDNRQADMKKQYDESQSIDTFDKNFRDYQSKHYYGGMYGPGYFAPGGAAQAYRAPEPYYVEQYYKDHPEAGADPFSQAPTYAGYSGNQYFSPQHPGMAAAMSAPVGSAGQASGATNPLPYGPELTGESGLGASITQNGTPVALSAWQRSHLDPTSLEHYNSYVGDIAGADPNDFKSYTQQESGNVASLKAPTSFSYSQ